MKLSTCIPWAVASIVMMVVATTAVVFDLRESPVVTLASRNCSASAISVMGGPILGAGGTNGDEFQLRYSGSGYCSIAGYPIWNFFNLKGQELTNGTSTFPASDLFGGVGTPMTPLLVRLDSASPVSTGFEYFYYQGTKSQDQNPPSCMATHGSLLLPLADGTGDITINRIPLAALKMNFCLIKSNLSVTAMEGSLWPRQTESTKGPGPYGIKIQKSTT